MSAVDDLDSSSTPGYCDMARFGPDNGTILKMAMGLRGREYDQERLDYLYAFVKDRINNLLEGIDESDDIKVFVKQEPHKKSKIAEGRFRIISAVSLVDTMIDRILFQDLMKTAVGQLYQTPGWIGFTPLLGGHRVIRAKFPKGGIAIDKSAWDWTVQPWMIPAWRDLLFELRPGSCPTWRRLVDCRLRQLYCVPTFRFSDGSICRQPSVGIQKSGCYLTLYLNTISQTLVHHLADPTSKVSQPICFGDDTFQAHPVTGEYLENLSRYCIVKEAVNCENFVEFAGYYMYKESFQPAYWQKHVYNLDHADVSVLPDQLVSYCYIWQYNPMMLAMLRFMQSNVDPARYVTDRELRRVAG